MSALAADNDLASSSAPVLLTGFEPFGGESANASARLVAALDGRVITGRRVAGLILPVVFGAAGERLLGEINRLRPALVVCTGQAAGRAAISLERVALNLADSAQTDNAGVSLVDTPVVPGGPAAYWSTLPLGPILAALRARGLPAELSLSAGSYVCNHVFYSLMHALRDTPAVPGGFVHLPVLPEQARSSGGGVERPYLGLESTNEALEIVIAAALAGQPAVA